MSHDLSLCFIFICFIGHTSFAIKEKYIFFHPFTSVFMHCFYASTHSDVAAFCYVRLDLFLPYSLQPYPNRSVTHFWVTTHQLRTLLKIKINSFSIQQIQQQ